MRLQRVLARTHPIVLVGGGGLAGAVSRHLVTLSLPTAVLGTLAVNVLGSFLLGALLSEGGLGEALSHEARLAAGTGFCASLTTYSTFAAQTTALSPRLAVANVAGNYALGMLAVLAGTVFARWAA